MENLLNNIGEITDDLIVGHLEISINRTIVGVFTQVKKPEDLSFLSSLQLRSRFNSDRQFKLFYFKTNEFEALNKLLDSDHDKFVDFLLKSNNINYMDI